MKPQRASTRTAIALSSLLLLCLGWGDTLHARQEIPAISSGPDSVIISDIDISGNDITKDWVILRELQLKIGDRVHRATLDSILQKEADKIFNTDLFVTSNIGYETSPYNEVELSVAVLEKWYTFPVPALDFGDRNFNEWWQNQDRDLSRLVYGFTFKRNNFRGRNEKLTLGFKLGFRKNLKLRYEIPYVNKEQTLGTGWLAEYKTLNNVAYSTEGNRLAFASTDESLRRELYLDWKFWYRKDFYTRHTWKAAYRKIDITDSLYQLNPRYLYENQQSARLFEFSYQVDHDLRNIQAYPTDGSFFSGRITQQIGLEGFFRTQLSASYTHFFPLSDSFFFSSAFKGHYTWSNRNNFSFLPGAGYNNDIIRGYDLYVITGEAIGISRNTLRMKLLDRNINLGFMPFKQFSVIPVGIYPKLFFDMGYVSNSQADFFERDRFSNRLLKGWGAGLDIFTAYNAVIRFEYSMNQAGESGLFVYWAVDI